MTFLNHRMNPNTFKMMIIINIGTTMQVRILSYKVTLPNLPSLVSSFFVFFKSQGDIPEASSHGSLILLKSPNLGGTIMLPIPTENKNLVAASEKIQ